MARRTLKDFELETVASPNPYTSLDRQRSDRLREQLVEEIRALEAQLHAHQESDEPVDFSMRQTCREMIHSRQQMFRKLL